MASAQVQITQLPNAGTITGNEAVPIVQNGVTVQTTTGAIAASPSQLGFHKRCFDRCRSKLRKNQSGMQ